MKIKAAIMMQKGRVEWLGKQLIKGLVKQQKWLDKVKLTRMIMMMRSMVLVD